jgi:hypothetical protein
MFKDPDRHPLSKPCRQLSIRAVANDGFGILRQIYQQDEEAAR